WPVKLLFEPAGVLIGLVHFSMPTMILILAAAISHIDRTYERAAASLGARPWRGFWRGRAPRSVARGGAGAVGPLPGGGSPPPRPDLRARRGQSRRATVAGLLAGDAAAVDARRGVGIARRVRVDVQRAAHAGTARRRPCEDDRQRREGPGPRCLQLAGQRSVRGGRPRHHLPAPGRGHARPHPRGWRRRMIGRVVVGVLVGFMTLPTAVFVVASFNPPAILSFPPEGLSLRWYVNALTYAQFQRAAVNSVIVTGASALLALPIGTAAALALVRRPLRARGFWSAMLLSPLIIPGVAIGLGFLLLAP